MTVLHMLFYVYAPGAVAGMFELTICSTTQGYHEYKEIWDNLIIGEELGCQQEVGNPHDTNAVAVIK